MRAWLVMMLLAASAALADVSLVPGDSHPFARTGIPDFVPSVQEDVKLAPGGHDWYREIGGMYVPREWAINYSLGGQWFDLELCTNEQVRISFGGVRRNSAAVHTGMEIYFVDDRGREFAGSTFEWDEGFACAEMVRDVGGRTVRYRAHPRGDFEYYFGYGDWPLFRPAAHRITADLYSSFLATYNAYFERLYFASQGQSNVWDEAEWGPTEAGGDFWWNLTNGVTVIDSHFTLTPTDPWTRRIVGHTNVVNLLTAVTNLGPFNVECYGRFNENASCFIYRPGWLLDDRGENGGSPLWWASSKVLADKGILQELKTRYYEERSDDPKWNEFEVGDPFISFGWTKDPLDYWDDVEGRRRIRFPWWWYGVTLDSFSSRVFNTNLQSSPYQTLWKSMGWYITDEIPSFEFRLPMEDFMATNVFKASAHEYQSVSNSLTKYRQDVFGSAATSWRLSPYHFVAANQTLALMDRTLHIPSLTFDCVISNLTVGGFANFKSMHNLVLHYDFDSGRFVLDGALSETLDAYETGGGVFEATESQGRSESIWINVGETGGASSEARVFFEDVIALLFIEPRQVVPTYAFATGPLRLSFSPLPECATGGMDGRDYYIFDTFLYDYEHNVRINLGTQRFSPSGDVTNMTFTCAARVINDYDIERGMPTNAVLGAHQPGKDAGDRARPSMTCLCDANLIKRDRSYIADSAVYARADTRNYSAETLDDEIMDQVRSDVDSATAMFKRFIGEDYEDYESYAPAPTSVTFSIDADAPMDKLVMGENFHYRTVTKTCWSADGRTNILVECSSIDCDVVFDDEGEVESVSDLYYNFLNPFTSEVEVLTNDWTTCWHELEITMTMDDEFVHCTFDPVPSHQGENSATLTPKVMTCVDWQWQSLRRKDE